MNRMKITHTDGTSRVVESQQLNLSEWFKNRQDVLKAEFLELDNRVTNANDLFYGCINLKEFISHVDLTNVNLMGAFYACEKLTVCDTEVELPFTITENPLQQQVGGSHYLDMKLNPLIYILANDLGFVEGCIVKYISRYKNKNGIDDLKKVKHYVEILIQQEEEKCK